MVKNNKTIILVAEGCPACEDLKEKISGNKQFKLMDVTKNVEASKLAKKLGVRDVPTFLYSDHEGKICTLDDEGKIIKCVKENHIHAEKEE